MSLIGCAPQGVAAASVNGSHGGQPWRDQEVALVGAALCLPCRREVNGRARVAGCGCEDGIRVPDAAQMAIAQQTTPSWNATGPIPHGATRGDECTASSHSCGQWRPCRSTRDRSWVALFGLDGLGRALWDRPASRALVRRRFRHEPAHPLRVALVYRSKSTPLPILHLSSLAIALLF